MTRIADFGRGLLGLVLILVLLVGIPTLLLIIVGFPLPTETPSIDLVRAHIESGTIPDLFLIKTLALVVWVVWVQIAVAIVAESVALLRGRVAGRAPVLASFQGFAAQLVASTVLLVVAFTPQRSAGAAPLVAVAVGTEPSDGPLVASRWPEALGPAAEPRVEPRIAAVDRASDGLTAMVERVYATRSGDSWWDLAERLLGDGLRWTELRSLNSGRTMLDGTTVTGHTESVRGGWHLLVPTDADPGLLESAPTGEAAGEPIPEGPERGGLARALRPGTLVFEGPTRAATGEPGIAYQVVEGDNLWDIAERHLGDPFRWPEIYERSTGLTQAFGRRITDPNLIWPDSILSLPADAVEVPPADPLLVAEVIGPLAGAATGEGEPSIGGAGDHPPRPIRPEDLDRMAARAGEAADQVPEAPVRADLVGDEDRRRDVSPPNPAPVSETKQASATDSDPDSDPDSGSDPYPDSGSDSDPGPNPVPDSPGRPVAPAAILGAGALLAATGLLGLLRRARRLRLAEMGEGSIPALPPMELVDIETVLRDGADRRRAAVLWRAVDSLTVGVRRPEEPLAPPELFRVGPSRVEAVLLGDDVRPPAPWRPVTVVGTTGTGSVEADPEEPDSEVGPGRDPVAFPDGRTVVAVDIDDLAIIDIESRGQDLDGGIPADAATPTLVTIGGGLLLNLEAVGVLAIDGPQQGVTGLIRSLVTELVTGPARHSIDVRVSDRMAAAELHPHGRHGPMVGLDQELASWLENAELALAATGASGPYALRAAGSPDALPGPVVIVANGTDQDELAALAPIVARVRRRRLPLAVVLAGEPDDGPLAPSVVARVADGQVSLHPHGIVAAAHSLDVEVVLGAEALIDHARRAPVVPRPEPAWGRSAGVNAEPGGDRPGDPAQEPTEETPEHEIATELPVEEEEITDRSDDTRPGLLVRVLGPVAIEGGPPDLDDERRSVLTFLALAGPSTTRQIGEAVWPGHPDEAHVEEVLAELRRSLGQLLPVAGDGRHRLRSTVTDLGSARRWINQARALTGERATNLLQLALADVRGQPFEGVTERHWQWIEDHRMAVATQATSLLMDGCFELCDQAYAADDLHLARWACDVAALVEPLQETVVTRRVQLLRLLDEPDQAREIVGRWERDFARAAGRPAPGGPRACLDQELVAPDVG